MRHHVAGLSYICNSVATLSPVVWNATPHRLSQCPCTLAAGPLCVGGPACVAFPSCVDGPLLIAVPSRRGLRVTSPRLIASPSAPRTSLFLRMSLFPHTSVSPRVSLAPHLSLSPPKSLSPRASVPPRALVAPSQHRPPVRHHLTGPLRLADPFCVTGPSLVTVPLVCRCSFVHCYPLTCWHGVAVHLCVTGPSPLHITGPLHIAPSVIIFILVIQLDELIYYLIVVMIVLCKCLYESALPRPVSHDSNCVNWICELYLCTCR